MSTVRHSPPGKKIPIVTIHHSPPQISWINDYVPHSPHLKFLADEYIHHSPLQKKVPLKKKDSLKKTFTTILHLLKGKFIKQITNKFLFISPSFSHYMIFFPFLIDLRLLKTVKENKFCKEDFFFSIFLDVNRS